MWQALQHGVHLSLASLFDLAYALKDEIRSEQIIAEIRQRKASTWHSIPNIDPTADPTWYLQIVDSIEDAAYRLLVQVGLFAYLDAENRSTMLDTLRGAISQVTDKKLLHKIVLAVPELISDDAIPFDNFTIAMQINLDNLDASDIELIAHILSHYSPTERENVVDHLLPKILEKITRYPYPSAYLIPLIPKLSTEQCAELHTHSKQQKNYSARMMILQCLAMVDNQYAAEAFKLAAERLSLDKFKSLIPLLPTPLQTEAVTSALQQTWSMKPQDQIKHWSWLLPYLSAVQIIMLIDHIHEDSDPVYLPILLEVVHVDERLWTSIYPIVLEQIYQWRDWHLRDTFRELPKLFAMQLPILSAEVIEDVIQQLVEIVKLWKWTT